MKFRMLTLLSLALLSSPALADLAWGKHQGEDFLVAIDDAKQNAHFMWTTNGPQWKLSRTETPRVSTRCHCLYFENSSMTVAVEYEFGSEWAQHAYVFGNVPAKETAIDRSIDVRGEYKGYGFTVKINANETSASLVWDDGARGAVLPATNSPSLRARCICIYFEKYPRLIAVEKSGDEYVAAHYFRLDQ